MQDLKNFDYIIIGGGSAGCVMANRLSENPKNKVLLLEAGGKDNYIWVKIPVGYLYCIGNPRTDWLFETTAQDGLNGRSLGYPRGKILGGCSSINGMIYMRGQARDYDHWRQLGNSGWGWDDCLPYFKKSEDHFAGSDEMHNAGGEWRIEPARISWEILDAFADACVSAGIPRTEDFNRGNNEGVGYFQVNQRSGWRWNAASAFLKPASDRKNLEIITGARADRIILENGRAAGIAFSKDGAQHQAMAAGEVILCSGAINSPQLLQLSGIGPGAILGDHGIAVQHELPGVGENLQDHLQLRCAYKVEGVKTLNEGSQGLFNKMKIGLEYAATRRGPMSMAPSQLGVFTKSDPSVETPDLQYHVQPLSLTKFGEPLDPFPAFTASVCNVRPLSRGHVRIASADANAKPLIAPNYLSTDEDRAIAAQAIRKTREIVAQPALAKFKPEEFRPGPGFQSEEELIRAAGDVGTTIFHPVGTAKMGIETDPMAVVDAECKVYGLDGLRVVDASVMPTITSGNTNSPTIMIAEKIATSMAASR